LSVPNLSGNEWKYIKDCLDTNWISSVGSYVTQFENKVAEFCAVKKAIATSNGTSALHISLMLAGVKQNDLVIIPNITFVAPTNVIKYTGADPVLIDVDEETWQMDLNILKSFLEKETSVKNNNCIHNPSQRRIAAIVPVHVLGNMCDMDQLRELSERYSITIVEDASEALGSYYDGKHAGSFGVFGCLSFNGNKIITTGGGGMILTNDLQLAEKAKHLTTQAKANSDEYYHDEIGYNYRLVNILAAMGVAQMEQLEGFLERKKQITSKYDSFFENVKEASIQKITEKVQPNNWLYTIKIGSQDQIRKKLLAAHIGVRPFWIPMNQLPAFRNDLYITQNDISDKVYKNCLSLPCSTGLTDSEQDSVISQLEEFYSIKKIKT
ncbi:MAG: LegC family aminotransferase, partial [Flavisolibacter sp.]